jgi:transposase
MDFLEKAGIKYLIRLRSIDYKAERAEMQSADEEVDLQCTRDRLNPLKQKYPQRVQELQGQQSIRVRILETVFANGEKAGLVTNLHEGTSGEIQRLYRKRWSIEKKFHTLKNKLKFESVTGKASIYVQQDFWAQALVFNIIQDLIQEAARGVAKKVKRKRYRYKMRINENIAIGLFKEKFIRLMVEEDDHLKDAMFRELIKDMQDNIVPVRTHVKSTPRKWNKANKYKCNQKPSF